MNDGKMGSISFDLKNENQRYEQIAAAEYIDEDGILIDIELTIDKKGKLFELDFWKVDFSPLVSYPFIKSIKVKKAPNIK